MSYEDQDFIMRQIKSYAKGIGVLLDISSLKELLKLEFSIDDADALSDREIESIIYTARIENYINRRLLSEVELEKMLGLSTEQLNRLTNTTETASEEELDRLKKLIEDEQYWLNPVEETDYKD